jgi:signal transduction histidine kinase
MNAQASYELLVQAVQRLSLARTVGEVQELVRATARELCGADGATFVLRDGPYCYYADEDAISPLWKGQRFPLETCISGWAMLNGRAAAIEDIYADERIPHEAYRPTFVKSLAMVPIRRIEPIGAIGNYWAEQHQPTEEEIELLQALADSTAVAMENVRVWSELEQHVADRTVKLQAAVDLNERIVGTLAHELRNCLSATVTLLDASLSTGDGEFEPTVRRQLEFAHRAARDGARVVEDQLAAAMDRAGRLRALPGEVVVPELLAELEGAYQAMRRNDRVELVIAAQDDLPVLFSDGHLLMLALRNLVSNALKFTDAGVVRLTAAGDGDGDADGRVRFAVADTGVGIAPADQQRIFEEWVQGDAANGNRGAGLGLPFVRRVAEVLDGELALESEPGKGTTVTLTVPVGSAQ